MAKCVYCGEETILHVNSVPVCINCDELPKTLSKDKKPVGQLKPPMKAERSREVPRSLTERRAKQVQP